MDPQDQVRRLKFSSTYLFLYFRNWVQLQCWPLLLKFPGPGHRGGLLAIQLELPLLLRDLPHPRLQLPLLYSDVPRVQPEKLRYVLLLLPIHSLVSELEVGDPVQRRGGRGHQLQEAGGESQAARQTRQGMECEHMIK